MREDSAQKFSKADLNDSAQNTLDIALEEFRLLILVAHSSPAHRPPVARLLCTHRAPIAHQCRLHAAALLRTMQDSPLPRIVALLTPLVHHRPAHTLLARRRPSRTSSPRIGPTSPSLSGNGFSESLI